MLATRSVLDMIEDVYHQKKDRIIGVMAIEMNLTVKHVHNNSIIHYICIFPKLQHKGYGGYFMSKVFKCDVELDGRVYAVTRLTHGYTPCGYEELEIEYSN